MVDWGGLAKSTMLLPFSIFPTLFAYNKEMKPIVEPIVKQIDEMTPDVVTRPFDTVDKLIGVAPYVIGGIVVLQVLRLFK